MTEEHYIQNQIRLWLGQNGYLAFRCNVGKVMTADGTFFNTGLPEGFSDLLVLGNKGDAYFIEVKSKTGKQRPCQKEFQDIVTKRGFKYILARSVDDVKNALYGSL